MPTPNLYQDPRYRPFSSVPEAARSTNAEVVFITDRAYDKKSERFGAERSPMLYFGVANVDMASKEAVWPDLEVASVSANRRSSFPVTVPEVSIRGVFPPSSYPEVLFLFPETSQAEYNAMQREAEAGLQSILAGEKRDALVFIHGYNNNFEDAVTTTAELWHFVGRQYLPVAYTWPAGYGGLRGYLTDYESGTFTLFHLKSALRKLADSPDIGKIHIIAHSRGTDVLMNALVELRDEWTRDHPGKFGNVVLASPDIDTSVFHQRFLAEELHLMCDTITIYLSEEDLALGLSSFLHGGMRRLGLFNKEYLPSELDLMLSYYPNVTFILARVPTNFLGHNYFYTNPEVSSDLILLMRWGRRPGNEAGRPLEPLGGSLWQVGPKYPWRDPALSEKLWGLLTNPLSITDMIVEPIMGEKEEVKQLDAPGMGASE